MACIFTSSRFVVVAWIWFSAVNFTLNNISVKPVLLVDEISISFENYRSVASHWQNWSNTVVLRTPRHWLKTNSQLDRLIGSIQMQYNPLKQSTIFSIPFDDARLTYMQTAFFFAIETDNGYQIGQLQIPL